VARQIPQELTGLLKDEVSDDDAGYYESPHQWWRHLRFRRCVLRE